MTETTEDVRAFGENVWIYCPSHRRPHLTGWCSVNPIDKVRLEAKTREAADRECRDKGLRK
jgi:hypothetical protein